MAPRTGGTSYHLHLTFDSSLVPGSSQIYNNHIPLDLDLDESVSSRRRRRSVNVARGQLVPYVITVANGIAVNLTDVTVVDRFPAGFRYVEGSARLDGEPREPVVAGRELAWTGLEVTPDRRHTLVLLLAVGSGVSEGEFVNRAQAMSALTGRTLSGEAHGHGAHRSGPRARLHGRHRQGLRRREPQRPAGRRRARHTASAPRDGARLAATTDPFGRFHITCAITPHEGRGTNFVLKLDDRTLPSGYRGSTQNLQVQRATRGKALEFNFGASIHRVIGLDLVDAVFEPGSIEMRPIWVPRLELLMTELRAAPAVLRLSYLADLEEPQLVEQRLDALRSRINTAWQATENCCAYDLAIEPEVFWRRGEPTDRARAAQGRWAMKPLERMMTRIPYALLGAVLASAAADAQLLREPSRGEAVERHLPGDRTFTQWVHDPSLVNTHGRRSVRGARSCRRGARDGQAHEPRRRRSASKSALPRFRTRRFSSCAASSMACATGATCGCTSWAMPIRSRCRRRWRPCSATTKACRASAPARSPSC